MALNIDWNDEHIIRGCLDTNFPIVFADSIVIGKEGGLAYSLFSPKDFGDTNSPFRFNIRTPNNLKDVNNFFDVCFEYLNLAGRHAESFGFGRVHIRYDSTVKGFVLDTVNEDIPFHQVGIGTIEKIDSERRLESFIEMLKTGKFYETPKRLIGDSVVPGPEEEIGQRLGYLYERLLTAKSNVK